MNVYPKIRKIIYHSLALYILIYNGFFSCSDKRIDLTILISLEIDCLSGFTFVGLFLTGYSVAAGEFTGDLHEGKKLLREIWLQFTYLQCSHMHIVQFSIYLLTNSCYLKLGSVIQARIQPYIFPSQNKKIIDFKL